MAIRDGGHMTKRDFGRWRESAGFLKGFCVGLIPMIALGIKAIFGGGLCG